jgi:hypothetical protein
MSRLLSSAKQQESDDLGVDNRGKLAGNHESPALTNTSVRRSVVAQWSMGRQGVE